MLCSEVKHSASQYSAAQYIKMSNIRVQCCIVQRSAVKYLFAHLVCLLPLPSLLLSFYPNYVTLSHTFSHSPSPTHTRTHTHSVSSTHTLSLPHTRSLSPSPFYSADEHGGVTLQAFLDSEATLLPKLSKLRLLQ